MGKFQKKAVTFGELGLFNHVAAESLKLASTTGFMQLPQLTTTQRNALTAANGMLIYNTTASKLQGYEGGAWVNLNGATLG